jgi:hypothetical protein
MAEQAAPRNTMVGGSPHVREVGPHVHQWAEVGAVATGQPVPEVYEACGVCGARRVRHGNFARATQAGWLGGGEWVGEGLYLAAMPILPATGLPHPPTPEAAAEVFGQAGRSPVNVTRGGEPVRQPRTVDEGREMHVPLERDDRGGLKVKIAHPRDEKK